MKFAKLSLAAVMALGVAAQAEICNVKVTGDAKLYYSTTESDVDGSPDMFSQDASAAQAAVSVDIGTEIDTASAKVGITGLATLGLEKNLVSGVWNGQVADVDSKGTLDVKSQWWIDEAYVAKSYGKTTFKLGRQYLDTPLAFSETWSIAANSMDAAVVLNQDIPSTTLVGAYVGRGNGTNGESRVLGTDPVTVTAGTVTRAVVNATDPYRGYGSAITEAHGLDFEGQGAYAAGIVTELIPMTTLQAWYYDVVHIAQAYWVQADANIMGAVVGAQYTDLEPSGELDGLENSTAWAAKLGVNLKELAGLDVELTGAYSDVDKDSVVNLSNTATGAQYGSQTKLYTEAWWNYGMVSAPGTTAFNVTATADISGVGVGAYYTSADQEEANGNRDLDELTVTAGTTFGSLEATLAYIYADFSGAADETTNTAQVYLTYKF